MLTRFLNCRFAIIGFVFLSLFVTAPFQLRSANAQESDLQQVSFFLFDIKTVLESQHLQIDELSLELPHTMILIGFYRDNPVEISADLIIQDGELLLDITRLQLNGEDRTFTSSRVELEDAFQFGLSELVDGRIESFEIQGSSLIVMYRSLPTPTPPPPTLVPSTLSSENAELLERSVNNTSNANSLAFNIDSEITIEDEDQTFILTLRGDGIISQISNPQDVQFDLTLDITGQLGEESINIVLQFRIIDGILYARGLAPSVGQCTRWITIAFGNVFRTIVTLLSEENPFTGLLGGLLVPVDSEGNANDLEPLRDLLDLFDFGQFARTTRIDVEGDTGRFRTDIDVLGFMDSPELVSLLTVLGRLGGFELERTQLEIVAQGFQMARSLFVPELDFRIERYIDLERELMVAITVDGEATINVPTTELSFHRIEVELDVNAQFSQIGDTFIVEVPEDQAHVDSFDDLEVGREDLIAEECVL